MNWTKEAAVKTAITLILGLLLISCSPKGSSVPHPPKEEKPPTKKVGEKILIVTEPFEPFMGPNLKDQGFLVALVKRVFEKAGYEAKVEFLSWSRAMMLVKEGRAHVLLGAYYTKERAQFLHFSQPLAKNTEALFVRKERGIRSYKSLKDLIPYTIGVVAKAAHTDEFDRASYLKKERVPTREVNVKKLIARRIDLIAEPYEVTRHLIKTRFPGHLKDIVPLDPPLGGNELFGGFSKKIPGIQKILDRFNRALEALKKDGSYDKLIQKYDLLLHKPR